MTWQEYYRKRYDDFSDIRARIYAFVVEYAIANNGITPTVREIVDGTDSSTTSVVDYHILRMATRGAFRISEDRKSRKIYIVDSKFLPPRPLE